MKQAMTNQNAGVQRPSIQTVLGTFFKVIPFTFAPLWLTALPAQAQEPTFFDLYQRPAQMQACNSESCWLEAISSCTPASYRSLMQVPIFPNLVADSHLEVWGSPGQGCVTYTYVENLWADGYPMPGLAGARMLCYYPQQSDVRLEWDVVMGRQEGTWGGEAGIVDPVTNVARTTTDINGRQISECDTIPPSF